jgi:hypothetical protein
VLMPRLMSERIKKLREEIAEISEANRRHMHRRDAGAAGDQERRLQRLQEILDELMTFTEWKKPLNIREAAARLGCRPCFAPDPRRGPLRKVLSAASFDGKSRTGRRSSGIFHTLPCAIRTIHAHRIRQESP